MELGGARGLSVTLLSTHYVFIGWYPASCVDKGGRQPARRQAFRDKIPLNREPPLQAVRGVAYRRVAGL